MIVKFVFLFVVLLIIVKELHGHGMVLDPVNRGSAGKAGFNVPINYDDTTTYCEGFTTEYVKNHGKCGECGDDYSLKRPIPNENGGIYGVGVIVKRYHEGQNFKAKVHISANHRGRFSFSICPLESNTALETEECFDKHPVKLSNGSKSWILHDGFLGDAFIDLKLPDNLVCAHCSFRWHWTVANNVDWCSNGTEALGCGNQEQFRTCSDISIERKGTKFTDLYQSAGSVERVYANGMNLTYENFTTVPVKPEIGKESLPTYFQTDIGNKNLNYNPIKPVFNQSSQPWYFLTDKGTTNVKSKPLESNPSREKLTGYGQTGEDLIIPEYLYSIL